MVRTQLHVRPILPASEPERAESRHTYALVPAAVCELVHIGLELGLLVLKHQELLELLLRRGVHLLHVGVFFCNLSPHSYESFLVNSD